MAKLTTEEFIAKAKAVHGDRYDYSKVKYVDSKTKVCIVCKEHGEFWQKPGNHLRGIRCHQCGIEDRRAKRTLPVEDFLESAKAIHGDKYDYSKVQYINRKTSVCIICPVHGEFWQSPKKHLAGHGCEKCFRESLKKRYALGNKRFIEKACAIYNSFYDYGKVNYQNSNIPVTITCPIHGDFQQKPSVHLSGHGCPHCGMIKRAEARTVWTHESCYEEAKKYKTKIEFKIAAPTAYSKARENGWLIEYNWFTPLRKDLGFWTKEQCFEEAKGYKTKTEFMEGSPTAYSKSLKNGWNIEYTWFANDQLNVYKGKVDSVYSYFFEEQNAVYVGRTLMRRQKDRDREHLYKTDRDAVAKFAKDNNCSVPSMIIIEDNLTLEEGQVREEFWIEEYKRQGYTVLNKAATGKGTGSLGMIGHGKWNRRSCYQEALKYKCSSEFENAKGSAYAVALYNGWLKDYTWFEARWVAKWDEKTCYEEAKKYKKRGDFQKGSPTAYKKARIKGWIDSYDWMLPRKKYPFGYWNNYDHCYYEAKKYHSRVEFEKGNITAYQKALKNGWIDDYSWFPEKRKNKYWNKETCYEEAQKYNNRTAFAKHSEGAYKLAKQKGWIDDYTWFKPLTGYWTYEACKAEAAKYEKRSHFKAGSKGAYTKSRIKGWLDDFFPPKNEGVDQ